MLNILNKSALENSSYFLSSAKLISSRDRSSATQELGETRKYKKKYIQ